MKNHARVKNLISLLPLFLLVICSWQQVAAQTYVLPVTGKIRTGDTCRTTDPVYRDPVRWAQRERDISVKNVVTFEVRHDTSIYFYNKPFQCTLGLDIEYYDAGGAQHQLTDVQLKVNFDTVTGKPYKGVAMYKFENGYDVKLTVKSITSPELGANEEELPAIFRIKNQLFIERKFLFQPANNDITHYAFVANNRQLQLNWSTLTPNPYPGAEFYDLEWTFYDDYSEVAEIIRASHTPTQIAAGEINIDPALLEKWFLNNNTRVTISLPAYTLSLPYPKGFLFYRVRGARIDAYVEERQEGDWTYKALAGGNPVSAAVYLANGHEPTLNYQYNAMFAEDGKKKETITYFDGVLSKRQAVLLNNSDQKAIVQESIYDPVGRPAVNILPSPEPDNALHFFRDLNKDINGNTYGFKSVFGDTSDCIIDPKALSTLTGSGRYYSPNNPHTDNPFMKYTPDAKSFPFSTTVYTPDQTGRISRQGGLGPTFQLDSGHVTRFFYGKPSQEELDRMFGSEAGNASHYLKNMIVDPNGQVSITYVDAHNRTVATALGGERPPNLYEMPGAERGSVTRVTAQLTTRENTRIDENAYTITSNSTFIIPSFGKYNFKYAYDPASLMDASCDNQEQRICSDCYYDLLITISDECGVIKQVVKPAVLTGLDTLCATALPAIEDTFSIELPVGEYYVLYQLQASRKAAEFYEAAFLKQNTCIKTLDDFKRQYLAQVDFTGCFTDCESCKTALGTKETFTGNFMGLLMADSMALQLSDTIFAHQLYDSLYRHCAENCLASINPCGDMMELLLEDLTPGGQYALYDDAALEDSTLELYLDGPVNILQRYQEITDYKDEEGNLDSLENDAGEIVFPHQLNEREFITYFKPSWALSLLKFHPEYCFLQWCELTDSSRRFDLRLQSGFSYYDEAADAGYWVENDPLALLKKDPFFKPGTAGAARYSNMAGVLNSFAKVMYPGTTEDVDILKVIKYFLYCAQDSTFTSWASCNGPVDCNAGRDEDNEWMLYRNFYQEEKRKQVEWVRKNHADPVIRNCKNCYIGYDISFCDPSLDPDCTVDKQMKKAFAGCPDQAPGGEAAKLIYAKKTRQVTEDIDTQGINDLYGSMDPQKFRDSIQPLQRTRLAESFRANCEANADTWMESLYCQGLVGPGNDSTKYFALRNGFIDVCVKGSDMKHPFGASTISTDSTHTDTSFQQVIVRVLGEQALGDSCTALLIKAPLPYGNSLFDTGEADDSCTCTQLQALKAEYAMRGNAGGFLRFMKRKFAPTFNLTESELDLLMKKCITGECVPVSRLQEIRIPDALRCKTCITCDSISAVVDTFHVKYPNLAVNTDIYERLYTSYLNQHLGFNLSYQEYWHFVQRCKGDPDEDLLETVPVQCSVFKEAMTQFSRLKPDYYNNPNGDTGIIQRYRQHITTWLNIYLNRNYAYNDYEKIAGRCGVAFLDMENSIRLACGQPIAPGDTVYQCPPSVMDCCSMDTHVQKFQVAFPQGINARLVAYYFEMKRSEWCAPIGLPDISYKAPYGELKHYFEEEIKFPQKVIIDITPAGTQYTFADSVNCHIDFSFGNALPYLDGGSYILCNRPIVASVQMDSLACMKEQFKMALNNAGLLHEQYIDSIRREYMELYMSRCLKIQPRLNMEGDLYEYHYTLFYYDQSGNLVKTIPPAGVRLLTDAEIKRVQADRPFDVTECFGMSDTLEFKGNGYIPVPPIIASRAAQPFAIESWLNLENTGEQGIFSDNVPVSASELFIDSTWTISAFNGEKGISCFVRGDRLILRYGMPERTSFFFPRKFFRTTEMVSTGTISGLGMAGSWKHVVINSTGNSQRPFRVYIDGRNIGFTTTVRRDTLGGPLTEGTADGLRIGAALVDQAWRYFKGYQKQLRIYNRQMSYPEIVTNMADTCKIPYNEGGLVLWLPMNEGRGELLYDRVQHQELGLSSAANFAWIRHHDPVYPLHTMPTNYAYNSLQRISRQIAPDAGTTKFWYDRMGRMVISQNAEQLAPSNGSTPNRYSFTKFDQQNREIEVGEKKNANSFTVADIKDDALLNNWMLTGNNSEITHTIYDQIAEPELSQVNLRDRVSTVRHDKDGDGNDESATSYSYDVSGNIHTLYQQIKELENAAPGQGLKKINYQYDLISGKLKKLLYQAGEKDQFVYKYLYNADNLLTESYSGRDNLVWQRDAAYFYYLHGPLARLEYGQYAVQGIDYSYTIQGWLKAINGAELDLLKDMGGDGIPAVGTSPVSKDVMSFTLGYFKNDYNPVKTDVAHFFNDKFEYPTGLSTGNQLFNGNISHSSTSLSKFGSGGNTYAYDQLNRMVSMKKHNVLSAWNGTDDYKEEISYDANGNILNYLRNGTTAGGKPLGMDDLTFSYRPNTNQLIHVKDAVPSGNYDLDIDNQADNNYQYDKTGNLRKDLAEGITSINWNLYNQISDMTKDGAVIQYGYDPKGMRMWKDANGTKTYYVREVSGNVLGVYTLDASGFKWKEQHLYGSERIGIWEPDLALEAADATIDSIPVGKKKYEINNHLGNVVSIVSDKKAGVSLDNLLVSYYIAEVLSQNDYYPFGMLMPERSWMPDTYRYGYNGKENDNEVKGQGNSVDFGKRVLDTRLGRWLSVDPFFAKYSGKSPYNYALNNPIAFVDQEGDTVKVFITARRVGTTTINLYSSTEIGNNAKLASKTYVEPVYEVKVSNESGCEATFYFTRENHRAQPDGTVANVTFDVLNDGDKFFGVVKSRFPGGVNNVLELRNINNIGSATIPGYKGDEVKDRIAIQMHVKGASDGCLLCAGSAQITLDPGKAIVTDNLSPRSSATQRKFMDAIMNFRAADVKEGYSNAIVVIFTKSRPSLASVITPIMDKIKAKIGEMIPLPMLNATQPPPREGPRRRRRGND